jgi:hypothetical protein
MQSRVSKLSLEEVLCESLVRVTYDLKTEYRAR